MSGDLDRAGFAEFLTARTRWIAVAAFAAVTAVAVAPLTPGAPVAAAAAVVAVGAAALLVQRRQPQLLYAAIATAGIAVLADGRSNNIGWMAVCLLATWCVLIDSRLEGLTYWAGAMIMFAVEWLWVRPDPGWGAWLAGVTVSAAFGLLIRHERDLLRQLRQAQSGLAEQAKTQERNRIAREMHDVIGHTLTVSLLHVQSARLAVEHDPADAARALAEAERLGRECLAEVRTTVGMLRQDGPADGPAPGGARTAPLPGADGLPALVEQFRSAGADVSLTVEGDTGGLPHHRPGHVPHLAGGADQRGQARARIADRGPADRRHGRGDADRGQPGRTGRRNRAGRGQHAGARRVTRRHLRGRPRRPRLAGPRRAPPRRRPASGAMIRDGAMTQVAP